MLKKVLIKCRKLVLLKFFDSSPLPIIYFGLLSKYSAHPKVERLLKRFVDLAT